MNEGGTDFKRRRRQPGTITEIGKIIKEGREEMRLKNKGMGQRLVTGQGDRVGTLCRVELRLAKSMRKN